MSEDSIRVDDAIDQQALIQSDSFYSRMFDRVRLYSPEIYRMFDIARLIHDETHPAGDQLQGLLHQSQGEIKRLQLQEETQLRSKTGPDIEDYFIDSMRSLTDFPFLLKKQFMLPDEIFDRKLMFTDLLIKKQHAHERRLSFTEFIADKNEMTLDKYLRRQRTYILLDRSGSTEKYDRLLLAKAIVFSFIENNQREKGEIFFRSFNHDPGPLQHATTPARYMDLLNEALIPLLPVGQTDIAEALQVAVKDIHERAMDVQAELLLITDGLSPFNASDVLTENPDLKVHVIKIGKDSLQLTDEELRENFMNRHTREFSEFETQSSKAQSNAMAAVQKLHGYDRESMRHQIQDELEDELRQLAKQSGGKYIEIEDIRWTKSDIPELLATIKREMIFLNSQLKDAKINPLQRERLLLQYLALRNYLNYLSRRPEASAYKNELQSMGDEMLHEITSSEELEQWIMNSRLQLQMSFGDMSRFKSVTMWELFRILFKKATAVIFRN